MNNDNNKNTGDEEKDKPKDRRGPPIWVESLLSVEDYNKTSLIYPNTFVRGHKPVRFNDLYHKGGKWRNGMGSSLTKEESLKIQKEIESLKKFVLEQNNKTNE